MKISKVTDYAALSSKITKNPSIPVDHLPKTLSNLIIQPLVDFTRTLFSENSNVPVVFNKNHQSKGWSDVYIIHNNKFSNPSKK